MTSRGHHVRAFISHASANLNVAEAIRERLQKDGVDAWLDHNSIQVGSLLRQQLQDEIAASSAVVLLWSKPAADSRWVAAEILMAYHLNRFILPCTLSRVDLPQFLSGSVHFDLARQRDDALARLAEQIRRAPQCRNDTIAARPFQDSALQADIEWIQNLQMAELEPGIPVSTRLERHKHTDQTMRLAEKRWPRDPTILNLAGYHRKNAYQFQHWDDYCAGRFAQDPLLPQAEKFFLDTLFLNPNDYAGLNGLGNILYFQGELDAAEFFVRRAIHCAKENGMNYDAARHDLDLILRRKVTI
jgi:hypothetical protein